MNFNKQLRFGLRKSRVYGTLCSAILGAFIMTGPIVHAMKRNLQTQQQKLFLQTPVKQPHSPQKLSLTMPVKQQYLPQKIQQ